MKKAKELLALGAGWKFLSYLFRCPSDMPASSIKPLISELPAEMQPDANAIGSMLGDSSIEASYHALLGSGGPISPYESDYQGPGSEGLRDKGVILGDVAGFYKAFAFDHSKEMLETPDHIAVELAFLSYLKLKEAYASMDLDDDAYRICREAEDKFLGEHLLRWIPQFLDSLSQHGIHEFYDIATRLLSEFSSKEASLCGEPPLT